jgi:hypothetical protein
MKTRPSPRCSTTQWRTARASPRCCTPSSPRALAVRPLRALGEAEVGADELAELLAAMRGPPAARPAQVVLLLRACGSAEEVHALLAQGDHLLKLGEFSGH